MRAALAAAAALVMLWMPALGSAQAHHGMTATTVEALKWAPLEIPGFAPGIEAVVIHGDPAAAGPFTLRLRFVDGYRFPAHYHPKAEHATVLEGILLVGMGTGGEPLAEYGPGTFIYIAPESPHHGAVRGRTILQIHGEGPMETILVKPKAAGGTR